MMRTLFLVALGGLSAVAQATEFVGQRTFGAATTRGAFLARGAGARPAAMGAAFTAVSDDASAMSWNPAGLGQLSSLSALAQHDLAGEGIAVSSLSAAIPIGETVAALSIAAVSYGTLEFRDETGAVAGEGALTDAAATQGWSFRNPSWLGGIGWSGFAVEVVQEARDSALLGLSVGTLIPLDGGITFGASLLHLGPVVDGMTLPRAFRVGSAYHVGLVNSALDISYGLADQLLDVGAGIEYRPIPQASIRAGWRQEGRGQGIAGSRGVTAGFGARFGRIGLDYAYQPVGDLATTHRLSVEYRLPGDRRPARLDPTPVGHDPVKPAPAKRREPTTKVMPTLTGFEVEGATLKPPVPTPVRPGAVSATISASPTRSTPVTPIRPAAVSATLTHGGPAVTPVRVVPVVPNNTLPANDDGPKTDPLLPPPAELETPGGDDGGLRGGSRGGGARPGSGTQESAPDAPLRGGR